MSIINPNGKDIFSVKTELCGRPLTIEVNRVGFRASFRYQLIMRRNFMLLAKLAVAVSSSEKVVQAMMRF